MFLYRLPIVHSGMRPNQHAALEHPPLAMEDPQLEVWMMQLAVALGLEVVADCLVKVEQSLPLRVLPPHLQLPSSACGRTTRLWELNVLPKLLVHQGSCCCLDLPVCFQFVWRLLGLCLRQVVVLLLLLLVARGLWLLRPLGVVPALHA